MTDSVSQNNKYCDFWTQRKHSSFSTDLNGSKFYPKSLTLLVPLVKMIEHGFTASQIARKLNVSKSLVSYHICNLKKWGYVNETERDTFKILNVTQTGKNFLAMYQQQSINTSICRAENVRFKAPVHKMPSPILVDWNKVQMHNWSQYTNKVDEIKIKLNDGKNPTIEFIPAAINGDDHVKLYCELLHDCNDVAKNLEQTLNMRIGRLKLSSKGEWVFYNPLAKAITDKIGRVTVKGIGKINSSLPGRYGEFEFYDPRIAAEFLDTPRRVTKLEQEVHKLSQYHKLRENN